MEATLAQGVFQLRLQVGVGYSSTCACSAALSRQLLEQGFLQAFAGEPLVEPDQVASWLRRHGTLATAHSQRSEAQVSVDLACDAPDLGILPLIARSEEHTSELQSHLNLVCRLLLEKKKTTSTASTRATSPIKPSPHPACTGCHPSA